MQHGPPPRRRHRDVEFYVDGPPGMRGESHEDAYQAVAAAVARSVALGGKPVRLEVLVYSRAGAKWWGGEDKGPQAAEQYEKNPEVSCFERIVIKAESKGAIG